MSVTTVVCKRCGTVATPGADRCEKCKCTVLGNALAVTHGGRRRPVSAQEARSSELFREWAADRGGDESLSAAVREVLVGAVGAVQIRDAAERYLAKSRAPLTSDRVQRALAVYFQASDRVVRAAQLFGLERKTKTIPDLAAYLRERS